MISFRWFGQACFEIKNSTTIVTNPHDGESVGLKRPDTKGNIVSISHQHFDHASGKDLASKEGSKVIEGTGKQRAEGVKIEGIPSYHDKARGKKRGENIIFSFELDEFRVCHLGDLGHMLSSGKVEQIKPVDILLVPVGGNYTINAREAVEVTESLEPNMVIPMHYKVKGLDVDISSEDEFLQLVRGKEWEIEEKEEAEIESLPEEKMVTKLECQAI